MSLLTALAQCFFFLLCVIAHQTSQVCARSVEVTGDQANTIPNAEAILEDFRVLGKDLVKSVEAKIETWSI